MGMEYSVNLVELKHLINESRFRDIWNDVIPKLEELYLDIDEPEEIRVSVTEIKKGQPVINEITIWTSHDIYVTHNSIADPEIKFVRVDRLIDRSLQRYYPPY